MAWADVLIAFKEIATSLKINQIQENVETVRDRLYLQLYQYPGTLNANPAAIDPSYTDLLSGQVYLPADYSEVLLSLNMTDTGGTAQCKIVIGTVTKVVDNSSAAQVQSTIDVSSLSAGWHDITVSVNSDSGGSEVNVTGLMLVAHVDGAVT